MTYTPPAGDALAISFTDRSYTPPTQADALNLSFLVGADIDYPIPPTITMQSSTGWQHAVGLELSTGTPWSEAPIKSKVNRALYGEATPLSVVGNHVGWDAVPHKNEGMTTAWGTPNKEEAQTQSLWANTRPTDPDPAPMPWDDSSQPKEVHTAALWGQPPAKDQHYAGPWFRVDTTGPEWNINDHRTPPLWADPPGALAFSFKGFSVCTRQSAGAVVSV